MEQKIDYRSYEPSGAFERPKESIEWTHFYAFNTGDESHPRVLLIGDSICNGYQGFLREKLDGKANVSFWISSKCVTSPGYFMELDHALEDSPWSVILFNNGLHSLSTPDDAWEKAFRAALTFISAKCPGVPLAVVNSTPLADPEKTKKAAELNAITARVAEELGLPLIDFFTPMDALDRKTEWIDVFHFKDAARERQAAIAESFILKTLKMENAVRAYRTQGSETGPDGAIR